MAKTPSVPIDCITPELGSPEACAIEATPLESKPDEAAVPSMQVKPIHTPSLRSTPILAGNVDAIADEGLLPKRATENATPAQQPRSAFASLSTEEIYRELLLRMGEDPDRSGLVGTPERVERATRFMTRGYGQTIEDVLHDALFDVDYDEMVIVRDVEFYSLCEHHLLPFFGKAHIAYIPNGKVVGLSKLPRLVDVYARRLQVQERLTRQIAEGIIEAVNPQGVGVILEAQHLCMMMRGVEKQQSLTTTSAMLGVFRSQMQTRSEFLSLLQRPGVGF